MILHDVLLSLLRKDCHKKETKLPWLCFYVYVHSLIIIQLKAHCSSFKVSLSEVSAFWTQIHIITWKNKNFPLHLISSQVWKASHADDTNSKVLTHLKIEQWHLLHHRSQIIWFHPSKTQVHIWSLGVNTSIMDNNLTFFFNLCQSHTIKNRWSVG